MSEQTREAKAKDTDTRLKEALARPYPVELHFVSDEDEPGYFLAFLPDLGLSACAAAGETREEALEELEAVKATVFRHYIETQRSLPEPTPGPHRGHELQQMLMRIPRDVHHHLKRLASTNGTSLNSYVRDVLVQHIAATEPEPATSVRERRRSSCSMARIVGSSRRSADEIQRSRAIMFDRTYVQGGPSRVSVTKTVPENRAPTDQSVQLLRELEEKALDDVRARDVGPHDLVVGAMVEVRNDPYSPDTELHIGFRLNGKWNRVVMQKPDHFRFDSASCFRLLAERLAVAIRDQLLKGISEG